MLQRMDASDPIRSRGSFLADETADIFAQMYSAVREVPYHIHMVMESYSGSGIRNPLSSKGSLHQAVRQDVEIVAEFMAGFSEWAYGVSVEPASQRPAAEGAIETGNLYLWMVDGHPVSMANIGHRSPRHARINAVYTPPASRKHGYASAIVAELCSIVESEGLVPMLYADQKNPDSNNVYQKLGFEEKGIIVDIKFD